MKKGIVEASQSQPCDLTDEKRWSISKIPQNHGGLIQSNMNSFHVPLIKLLVIGDSGVGKTSLICQFVDNQFIDYGAPIPTMGIDFKMKNLTVCGQTLRVQIWDTAGQERFETVTTQYYRRAQAIFLTYDITNSKSFARIGKWLQLIREKADEDVYLMLLGNKKDKEQKRQVSTQMAEEYARFLKIPFHETSAKQDDNIENVFLEAAESLLQSLKNKYEKKVIDKLNHVNSSTQNGDSLHRSTLTLSKDNEEKSTPCCSL